MITASTNSCATGTDPVEREGMITVGEERVTDSSSWSRARGGTWRTSRRDVGLGVSHSE